MNPIEVLGRIGDIRPTAISTETFIGGGSGDITSDVRPRGDKRPFHAGDVRPMA